MPECAAHSLGIGDSAHKDKSSFNWRTKITSIRPRVGWMNQQPHVTLPFIVG